MAGEDIAEEIYHYAQKAIQKSNKREFQDFPDISNYINISPKIIKLYQYFIKNH